jgi:hypothetical protein
MRRVAAERIVAAIAQPRASPAEHWVMRNKVAAGRGAPRREVRRRPIVAHALASELAAVVEAGDREREDLMTAALGAGAWLAAQGRPGCWESLDVEAVLPAMDFAAQHQVDAFLLSLVGLVGHAAFSDQLARGDACRILAQIRDLASNRVVSDLAGQTAGQLRAMPPP